MRRIAFTIACVVTAAVSPSRPALAGGTKSSCTVTSVAWTDAVGAPGTPQLQVACSGDLKNYGASIASPACGVFPTPTVEVLKGWLSIFQSALLSGRPVDFGWETCSSPPYTTQIVNFVKLR